MTYVFNCQLQFTDRLCHLHVRPLQGAIGTENPVTELLPAAQIQFFQNNIRAFRCSEEHGHEFTMNYQKENQNMLTRRLTDGNEPADMDGSHFR